MFSLVKLIAILHSIFLMGIFIISALNFLKISALLVQYPANQIFIPRKKIIQFINYYYFSPLLNKNNKK